MYKLKYHSSLHINTYAQCKEASNLFQEMYVFGGKMGNVWNIARKQIRCHTWMSLSPSAKCFHATCCMSWSWKPDCGELGVKTCLKYRHTYRKTGVRWAVWALLEWHQLHNNLMPQHVYYVQHRGEVLASLNWDAVSGFSHQAKGSCAASFGTHWSIIAKLL